LMGAGIFFAGGVAPFLGAMGNEKRRDTTATPPEIENRP
jgi:hypothetical protein